MTSIAPMTIVRLDRPGPPALYVTGTDRLVRSALFLATFLQIWLTASPFPDLSDASAVGPSTDPNLLGQVVAVLLTGALALFALSRRIGLLFKVVTPILVLTLLWFACSAVFSLYPSLALRRLVLATFVIFQAAMFLFLPQDRNHLARLLAIGALLVLALCYAGVIFAPGLSIHQPIDLAEPQIAGDWRGFFAHKNGAGAGMVILIIMGIYIFRTLSSLLGLLIIAFAAFFLVCTASKSSITLLPFMLIFSAAFVRLRNPTAKFLTLISVPATIAVLTIGSVAFDGIYAVVDKLMSDPTFTGRNDIWQFTLEHIAQRPIVGFGYQAFWGTSELVNSWTYLESWGYRASDAHNGFLNIAVMTGLVGLVLTIAYVVCQPFLDDVRSSPNRVDHALKLMFVQAWLFGLYLSGFESELFNSGSVVWFMMAASIIGLRLQAINAYGVEPG